MIKHKKGFSLKMLLKYKIHEEKCTYSTVPFNKYLQTDISVTSIHVETQTTTSTPEAPLSACPQSKGNPFTDFSQNKLVFTQVEHFM